MHLLQVPAPDFDLEKTLDSGQVFHWQKIGNTFWGTIAELPLSVEQHADTLKVRTAAGELDGLKPSSFRRGLSVEQHADILKIRAAPRKLDGLKPSSSRRSQSGVDRRNLEGVVAHYFALDHPLSNICAAFPRDPGMTAARDFCRGLRIIRQPKWECLATFICSSMKQVAHIRQISLALRKTFGARKLIYGNHVYGFPSAARLAATTEKELRACALGYRAKNLLATARLIAHGEANLEKWSKLPDELLRERLCELPGVGAKVANCVMLFAFERLRAFPIDVWIERVLRQQYFPRKRKVTAQQLRDFCARYFGENGGYAQQYLFHHARKGGAAQKAKARAGC